MIVPTGNEGAGVELIRSKEGLAALDALRREGPLVLVPTMGALHDGHLSLVAEAARHGRPVVSIFVNPTQFGPGEDFESYPRDLRTDLEALRPLDVAAVFAPTAEQMYAGAEGVRVRPGPRSKILCGASRPGHFEGVLTVVAKLLHLIGPRTAVFGRKDAQQCLVIDEMVRDLDFPVRLVDAPTLREDDGLAMSSRNRYLDAGQRERARCLSAALRGARDLIAAGERDGAAVERELVGAMADGGAVEYAEARRVPDLARAAHLEGRILLAVAVRIGPARLIDNIVLDVGPDSVAETGLFMEER